jgi:hypothetical protein
MTASIAPPGREQREPLVRHLEAPGLDPASEVPRRERPEGCQGNVVRHVQPDEEPAPVRIGSGEVDEVAMRDRDHLGRVLDTLRHGVDRRSVRRDCLLQDRPDDRLLAREVVVEGAEADVGLVGDLVDPRVVDALAGEEGARGRDQLRPRLLAAAGVPADRLRRHGRHATRRSRQPRSVIRHHARPLLAHRDEVLLRRHAERRTTFCDRWE